MKNLQQIWDGASEKAKERYRAFTGEDSFSECDEEWELKDQLKFMQMDYYLEDRSSDEGICCGVAGYNDEEKAIDNLLEGWSKYGEWYLYKWDAMTKTWLNGQTKRKGRNIEIVWSKH